MPDLQDGSAKPSSGHDIDTSGRNGLNGHGAGSISSYHLSTSLDTRSPNVCDIGEDHNASRVNAIRFECFEELTRKLRAYEEQREVAYLEQLEIEDARREPGVDNIRITDAHQVSVKDSATSCIDELQTQDSRDCQLPADSASFSSYHQLAGPRVTVAPLSANGKHLRNPQTLNVHSLEKAEAHEADVFDGMQVTEAQRGFSEQGWSPSEVSPSNLASPQEMASTARSPENEETSEHTRIALVMAERNATREHVALLESALLNTEESLFVLKISFDEAQHQIGEHRRRIGELQTNCEAAEADRVSLRLRLANLLLERSIAANHISQIETALSAKARLEGDTRKYIHKMQADLSAKQLAIGQMSAELSTHSLLIEELTKQRTRLIEQLRVSQEQTSERNLQLAQAISHADSQITLQRSCIRTYQNFVSIYRKCIVHNSVAEQHSRLPTSGNLLCSSQSLELAKTLFSLQRSREVAIRSLQICMQGYNSMLIRSRPRMRQDLVALRLGPFYKLLRRHPMKILLESPVGRFLKG